MSGLDDRLDRLARATGTTTEEQQMALCVELVERCTPDEIRFLERAVANASGGNPLDLDPAWVAEVVARPRPTPAWERRAEERRIRIERARERQP